MLQQGKRFREIEQNWKRYVYSFYAYKQDLLKKAEFKEHGIELLNSIEKDLIVQFGDDIIEDRKR